MGDWIVRLIGGAYLIATGFVAGAVFVEHGLGTDIGFPYSPTQRLQWEVLLSTAIAIGAGLLAYIGATAPHRLQQRQYFKSYGLKVREELAYFMSLADVDYDQLKKLESDPIASLNRRHGILDNAAYTASNLPQVPDEIASITLAKMIDHLKFLLRYVASEKAENEPNVQRALRQAQKLVAYLERQGGTS